MDDQYVADMVQAYVECAIWAGLDYYAEGEEPRPMDENYDSDDVSDEAMAEIRQDCQDFYSDNRADLADWEAGQAGHDFQLTRNGHGTGFWDRGKEAGDRLTKACRPYGTSELYAGNDGKLYLHG